MRKNSMFKMAPALVGLGSLSIYILACTSFSPDDSKVLFDTVDGKTGMTAVAVYDRKTAKTELLFKPFLRSAQTLETSAAILRPQWLDNGHSFLTSWRAGDNTNLNLAILPFDRRGPARFFQIADLTEDEANNFYCCPLPVVGNYLFLAGPTNTNSIIRLDLVTGEVRCQTNQQKMFLFPSPANDRVYCLTIPPSNAPSEMGLLDPLTMTPSPRFHIEKGEVSPWSLALSRDARILAYQLKDEDPPLVHLLEAGKPEKTLSLASLGKDAEVMVRHFSLQGDLLYASIKTKAESDAGVDYGFAEIPLNGSLIRKIILISNAPKPKRENNVFNSFQIDLSHDGKTLAVESLWLASIEPQIPAKDCALFLVDLSKPARKITKIPIPLPPLSK
jgi:hypothetical protein